ncbi:MAG TPA: hypothetical protein V6D03_13460, partial [Candidatus Caenarcaniphilales bacterium]
MQLNNPDQAVQVWEWIPLGLFWLKVMYPMPRQSALQLLNQNRAMFPTEFNPNQRLSDTESRTGQF